MNRVVVRWGSTEVKLMVKFGEWIYCRKNPHSRALTIPAGGEGGSGLKNLSRQEI